MDKNTVDKLNLLPIKIYFAITGGGTQFIGDYLKWGGASKVVAGCHIPYSPQAFEDFVGHKLDSNFKYCSEKGARELAFAAYQKASKSNISVEDKCFGIGVTCSLMKENERKGREHHVFIAVHSNQFTKVESFDFQLDSQYNWIREDQEACVAELIEYIYCSLFFNVQTLKGSHNQPISTTCALRPELWNLPIVPINDEKPIVLFPGSWNPFHLGHSKIVELSSEILKTDDIILELSIANADKGGLDYIEVNKRMNHVDELPFVITDAPTFKDKVIGLKNKYNNPIIFIVGHDTWDRIWEEKYAGPLNDLAKFFVENRVKFLIFGQTNKKSALFKNTHDDWPLSISSKTAEYFDSNIRATKIRLGDCEEGYKNKINNPMTNALVNIFKEEYLTSRRKELGLPTRASIQSKQFPTSFQTIDNIVVVEHTRKLLLGQKIKDGDKWRFLGGFVDPKDISLEETAIRELKEEAGDKFICSYPIYLFSYRVDDPRYKTSNDKILTAAMLRLYKHGHPVPSDDLKGGKIEWFDIDYFKLNYKSLMISEHVGLAEKLINGNIIG